MTRNQEYAADVRRISLQFIKNNMPEPRMLDVSMCCDFDNFDWGYSWSWTKIASGLEKQFIAQCGFEKCLKRDATICMIIGKRHESGCWLIGKCKTYWLKPKTK